MIESFDDYQKTYEKSIHDPEKFWSEIASKFNWKKPWSKVLEWNFEDPKIEWFKNGKLNITENCLDRHLPANANKVAYIWESNDPVEKSISLTYQVLLEKVCRVANVLKNNGVAKGDRVCIYMPMVPELAISVLACARIGAVHSVVFGGFSAHSIADRINDAKCKMVITADGAFRGNKEIPLKSVIDDALVTTPSVEKVLVLTRTRTPVSMIKGRDLWLEDEEKSVSSICPAETMDAEDPLFILYTSGSTGKPKGVVHTCGGYMVYTGYTFQTAFGYREGDIYFCTADIGWITGHSYIVYAPLLSGATTLIFEGIPTYPNPGRFWDIIQKHKVSIFYTAPTAIRSLMSSGLEFVKGKNLNTLRILGSVGEPLNEEAWHWYDENIGQKKCPIIDTWWQTETGGFMISPIANVTPLKPGFASLPLPGVQLGLMDESGKELIGNGVSGNLVIKFPWPGIMRTLYNDLERCRKTYFSTYPKLYFTGDGALRDSDGYYKITGRVDDVINVSGHRIGTAEVENAINMHLGVIESAVVAYPHEIKGQGIYAFVITDKPVIDEDFMRKNILQTVTRIIGPIAKPDKIQFVMGLPKTRSGKIMRRILRKIAEKDFKNLGDTSTLLDPNIVEEIIQKVV